MHLALHPSNANRDFFKKPCLCNSMRKKIDLSESGPVTSTKSGTIA